MNYRKRHDSQAGFVLLDAVVALSIAVALMITLTVAMGHHKRAVATIADRTSAYEKAEQVLFRLQAGGAIRNDTTDAEVDGTAVNIERLPDRALAGQVWVRVTVVGGGGSTAEVYGMVPEPTPADRAIGGSK